MGQLSGMPVRNNFHHQMCGCTSVIPDTQVAEAGGFRVWVQSGQFSKSLSQSKIKEECLYLLQVFSVSVLVHIAGVVV